MTPTELLKDFESNRRYGTLEFVFKDGNVVFMKKVETLLPYEKNSMAAPKEYHGTNHRFSSEDYR
jgi:hypothetical protein